MEVHEAAPYDPGWARSAAATLHEDVADLEPELPAELLSVDCRSNSCALRFRFDAFTEALANFDHVLTLPTRLNCSRHLAMPEPDVQDVGLPYVGTLLIQCNPADPSPVER